MGVKSYENLLRKIAHAYVEKRIEDTVLFRAAILYARAKTKARDNRDKWKMRKRLGT